MAIERGKAIHFPPPKKKNDLLLMGWSNPECYGPKPTAQENL